MNFLPSLERVNEFANAESAMTRLLAENGDVRSEGTFAAKRRMSNTGRIAYTMPRETGSHGNLSVVLARPGSVQAARQWIRWRGREELLIGFSTNGTADRDDSPFLAHGGVGQMGSFPQSESDYVYRTDTTVSGDRRVAFL